MPEKRYDTDWAKAKSRDLVKDMIGKTISKFVKPKDIRVLCFPGIDCEEISQVYDSLGIPRGNIVGVERDAEIADAIEAKNLGIELFRKSLEDYVAENPRLNFDVISLDYIGPIDEEKVKTIKRITQNQVKNHFVLHTANLLRRDKNSHGLYHYGYMMTSDSEDLELFKRKGLFGFESMYSDERLKCIVERSNGFTKKLEEGEDFNEEKKGGYTVLIRSAFSGNTKESLNAQLRFVAGDEYKPISETLRNKLKQYGKEIGFDEDDPFGSAMRLGGATHAVLQYTLEHAIHLCLEDECKEKGIDDKVLPYTLDFILSDASANDKFFRIKDISCYSYISESGAPMIGDVYFLSYPEREVRLAKDLARSIGFPNELCISDAIQLYKDVIEYSKAAAKFLDSKSVVRIMENERNRLFLGNSSKPVLTKKRAIEEFMSGATVDDLKEKYRGWVNKPLPQWKAHVTMHTYDAKESLESGHDSDIEKITKEEVLDLLSSGIPTKEIFDAFPTSFSTGQLRYYKSQLTRGSYKNKE